MSQVDPLTGQGIEHALCSFCGKAAICWNEYGWAFCGRCEHRRWKEASETRG